MARMAPNRFYSGPASDHFDGARFFNTAPITSDRTLGDLLRWRWSARPGAWPPASPVALVAPEPRSDATRITIVGHATALIQARGLNLLTDPVWSARASPVPFVGPRRVSPPAIAFDDLPRIDVVLLSHNHYDHLDIATLRRLVARDDPLIVTPLGNDGVIHRNIPRARLALGDWWDRRRLADDVEITFLPAQHWSARGLFDRRRALWCGFALQAANEWIYVAGDTGYGDGSLFTEIRRRIGSPAAALLPIGAYAPRWFMAAQHCNPEEAVMIFEALNARLAAGVHWGVFRLSDEGWDEPREALARALAKRGVAPERFAAGAPGHVLDLSE